MKIRQYIEKFGLWIVSITSGIPMKSGSWNHNNEAFLYRGLIAELQISKNKYLAYKIHKDNYWQAFDRTALQEKTLNKYLAIQNKVKRDIQTGSIQLGNCHGVAKLKPKATALQEKMVAEVTEKMLNKIRNEK